MTNGTANVFVNGVVNTTATPLSVSYNSTYPTLIGVGTGEYFNGYIRDLRVVQGGVVPVANFTPGAAPFSYASPGYVANMGTTVFTLLGQFITYVPGKYNQALRLMNTLATPSQNYIQYTYPTAFDTFTGMTICFWMKMSKLPGTNVVIFQGTRWYAIVDGASKVEFVMVNNAGTYRPTNINYTLVVDTWYHFAYTSINGVVSTYIDASPRASRSDASTQGVSAETSLGIASSAPGVDASFDDLRIYNTALTAAQVQSVYSSQGAPAPSRAMPLPKLAWDFNGTTTDYVSGLAPARANVAGIYTSTTPITWPYYNTLTPKYGAGSLVLNNPTAPYPISNCVFYRNLSIPFGGSNGSTVCMWFKLLKVYTAGGDNTIFFISKNGGGLVTSIILGSAGKLVTYGFWVVPGGSGNFASTVVTNTVGIWYHVSLVTTSTSQTIYVNGTNPGVYDYSSTPIVGDSSNIWNSVALCSYDYGANPGYGASVEIDDLRIFDRSLTSLQVQAIYNQQGTPGLTKITGPTSFTLPVVPGYTYIPFRALPPSFTLTQTVTSNAWTYGSGQITDGGANPTLTLVADVPGDLYSVVNPRVWYRLGRQGGTNEYVRHGGFVMSLSGYAANNFDFAWAFFLKDGTTNHVKIWNPYPANGTGYWVQSGLQTAGRIAISTTDPNAAHVYAMSTASTPYSLVPSALSGTPLFRQIPSSVVSSAVGAFSLRAVNGLTAKVVQVQAHPVGIWPPVAMTSNTTTATGTFNGVTNGVYTASESPNAYGGQNNSYRAFDSDTTGTYWHSALTYNSDGSYAGTTVQSDGYTGEWLQIQFPTPIILYSYSMINRINFDARTPRNFRIYGSNNGTDWTIVDARANITQWLWPARLTFTVTNPVRIPYNYFRMVVNATSGPNSIQISSWILNGPAAVYTTGSPTDFWADRLGKLWTTPYTGQDLGAWLGGAIGYVTKWYDQSGKGNDASQATAANQPVIQRATKGPGYSTLWPGLASTRLVYGTSSNLFDSTNYSVCVAAKRTAAVSTTTYYAGTNGQAVQYQNLGLGYSTDTATRHSHYAYSNNGPSGLPAYAGAAEPIAYDYFAFSQTTNSGFREYSWRSGTNYTSGNSGLTIPLSRSGNSTIGGTNDSASFTGEIYELLVFTQSLYDLDTSGGLITQIYTNQSGYTGI